MEELAPGLWHWTARHDRIGVDVSSYYLEDERVVIDPMLPPGGVEWFEQHRSPEHVLMTNRHHDRHAWELRDAFGCSVHCVRNGVYELEGRGPVEPYDFGDELPGGAIALACADGVVHYGNGLGFVPDRLMDEPELTKRLLREAYLRLLDLDFDVLLLAHGTPIATGGKNALRELATGGSD